MKGHLREDKPAVLMIGNYPPPYGGIAVVIRDLLESPLSQMVDFIHLNTTKPRYYGNKVKHLIVYIHKLMDDIISLIKILKNSPVDIAHIHTSYDWGWPKHIFYLSLIKFLRPNVKVILHLHAYDRRCKGRFPYVWFRKYIFSPLYAFKKADGIITLTDGSTELIRKYLSEKGIEKPVITVSNGVLLSRFEKEFEKENEKIQILYMGSLVDRKGIYELIKILPLLEKVENLKVVIGGDGPAKDDVIRYVRDLKNAVYVGRVDENRKIELFLESDIFLLQSKNEGIPIAILEALAGGLAIITTRVGGIPEILREGENAIFITPGNSNELYEAITYLVKNPGILERMKENNRKLSREFSWEKKSKQIYELYKRVMRDE